MGFFQITAATRDGAFTVMVDTKMVICFVYRVEATDTIIMKTLTISLVRSYLEKGF